MIGLKKLDISGNCLWKNDTVFLNKLFLLVEKYKNCQDFHFVSELELKKEKLPPGWMPASKFEFAKSLIMLQTLQVSDTLPVIPLDLSESELNNLLDLYLEKRPDLISRTRTWSECYPSISERLRLKSILAQIALLSESLLTLTDHPVAPDSILSTPKNFDFDVAEIY